MKLKLLPLLATLILAGCTNSVSYNETNLTPQQMDDQQTKEMQLEPKAGDTVAKMKTSEGEIHVLLYTEEAPKTTDNFRKLVEEEKYNNTIFHRVISGFMVQGGDFTNHNGTGGHSAQGPGTSLKDELAPGLKHLYGAVSMANKGIPNTGGSQFFIVQAKDGTRWLDGKHAIFGYVYEGMDIVEKIAATEVDANDKPLQDIKVESIEITKF